MTLDKSIIPRGISSFTKTNKRHGQLSVIWYTKEYNNFRKISFS